MSSYQNITKSDTEGAATGRFWDVSTCGSSPAASVCRASLPPGEPKLSQGFIDHPLTAWNQSQTVAGSRHRRWLELGGDPVNGALWPCTSGKERDCDDAARLNSGSWSSNLSLLTRAGNCWGKQGVHLPSAYKTSFTCIHHHSFIFWPTGSRGSALTGA